MIDLTLIADYAWSDIAKAAKAAMVSAALGGKMLRMPDGREIGRIDINEAKALYEFAIQQVQNEQNPGDGGILLADFRDS